MIDAIISIIANIFSIFGITIDIKKTYSKLKQKKFRNIFISLLFCGCCIIIVYSLFLKQKSITVTKVTLSKDSLTMNINESNTLVATVLYSDNSINNDVLWTSSNNLIVTVDQNGLITALADGSATIIAQASRNNTTEIAECTITIKSPPSGYSISVHQTSVDSYAYIYVTPYNNNITNIQIYAKSPSGELFIPKKDENDLYRFYSECGIWTIYASIENDAGIYEAHKPEDFITIDVTNITDTLDDSINILNNMFQQLIR